MQPIREITTRELLREFKSYKDLLIAGRIRTILIPADKGRKIVISLQDEKSTGENLAKTFSMGRAIKVTRHNIFDDLENEIS